MLDLPVASDGRAAGGTQSLVADVVDGVTAMIAAGELGSGERVAEAFLESRLGASRYIVREALRVLVTQGVLEKVPHSGCRVTHFDEARLHQITAARLQVELLVLPAAAAALRDEPALATRLDRALDRLAAAVPQGETAYAEADLAFHRAVVLLSGDDIALRLWETLLPHVRIVRAILGERVDDLAGHVAEHRALRDALVLRPAVAEAAWRGHLMRHLDEGRAAGAPVALFSAAPARGRPGAAVRRSAGTTRQGRLP